MSDIKESNPDISDLRIDEPKYSNTPYSISSGVSLAEIIENLEEPVFIRPEDPWITVRDSFVRLPIPPEGYGISMKVHAKTLSGIYGRDDMYPKNLILPLTRILTDLDKGAVILNDGSIYISGISSLSKIEQPLLDAPFRIITSFFTDEELFKSVITTDKFGYKRQVYNQKLATKSLALSKSSYNMRIKQFIKDGWLDYTLIHEGQIKSTEEDWITKPSGVKQFISTIKQLIATQSVKAVVMGKPTSDGGAIINITFTGTKHATDWLNNIKVGVSNDLHRGFYELALNFDSIIKEIKMPRLAGVLGIENLDLPKILEEGRSENSKFKFWITGHSQGGSLTQIYIAEFMIKRGIRPENIFGYTFASPTVATTKYSKYPANFPVYNIINMDDFAVRVGSALRLGMDIVYFPDEKYREIQYINYTEGKKAMMYKDIRNLCYWLTDSFKFGEFMIAMATFAGSTPSAKNFLEWLSGNPLLKSLYDSFTVSKDFPDLIRQRMLKMLEKPYLDVGGKTPSEERILQIRDYLEILYNKWGMDCLREYMYSTHEIPHGYSLLVAEPESKFYKCIWSLDMPPKLLTEDGNNLMEETAFPEICPDL